MADSSKAKSRPAPPPWAKDMKPRRSGSTATANTVPIGPKAIKPETASQRKKIGYAPHKPPPPKPFGVTTSTTQSLDDNSMAVSSDNETSPANKARVRMSSSTYKPTPFALAAAAQLKPTEYTTPEQDDAPPMPKRAASVYTQQQQHHNQQQRKRPPPSPKRSSQKIGPSPPPPSSSALLSGGHHPHTLHKSFSLDDRERRNTDDDDEKLRCPPQQNPPPVPAHLMKKGKLSKFGIGTSPRSSNGDMHAHMFGNAAASSLSSASSSISGYRRNATTTNMAGFDNSTLLEIEKCGTDALLAGMHEGSECLAQFHDALASFCKQQQQQCHGYLGAFRTSKARYAQIGVDGMPGFIGSVALIHTLMEETVKQSAEFAAFIETSCLPMISEMQQQCGDKYKQITHDGKGMLKKLNDSRAQADKQRKLCKTAAEKVVIARQRSETQKQNAMYKKRATTDAKNRFADMMKPSSSHATSSDALINDAYATAKEQERRFKAAVAKYNETRMEFIDAKNADKHELIQMEHFRVDSMLSVMRKVVNQQTRQKDTDTALRTLQQELARQTEATTAKAVLTRFIECNVTKFGEEQLPEAQEATLEIEYRDMFNSIEDAMSITLEINPHVKIPLILPLLCGRIRDLHGFKTEGLFRKSPSRNDMLRVKKRLQVKNFQLNDESNVHVYASLLKEWLRGLQDLVIPKRYYDYCVEMAHDKKLTRDQFEVFFSQLPSVNRECLKYIINFLKELLQPQYQEHTKMDLENIAIVFGPTLLMPPTELEPQKALMNAKAEKQFVISLIQNS